MTASAADIAAALRHERPDLTPGRLHKLLYLAQGHHLAWFGQPLFAEPISAWDTGPVVGQLRGKELDGTPGHGTLDNKTLNTVGYVASRYGNLHLHDLDLLTRHSAPFVAADRGRRTGTAVPIDHDALGVYFKTVDMDPDAPMIDAARLKAHLAAAEVNRDKPTKPDDLDAIRAWAASLHTQAASA